MDDHSLQRGQERYGTITNAEYQGKQVTLDKPFRTPKGPKKFAVYVKNKKGNVIIVRFGDPDMEIKRDDPERRKSFRARHKCDMQKDKTTAAYWSCRMWGKSKTDEVGKNSEEPGSVDNRCWEGYEPVPGKEPYSKGSCRKMISNALKRGKQKFGSNKPLDSMNEQEILDLLGSDWGESLLWSVIKKTEAKLARKLTLQDLKDLARDSGYR